jgi:cobalt/nickel transport system permease protein
VTAPVPSGQSEGSGRTRPSRRLTIGVLVAAGLLVALVLAIFVSPFASSSPDGLEKVAADKAIDSDQRDHTLADGPVADYAVRGVDNVRLSTGLAGVVGVAVTFAVGGSLFLVLRRNGSRRNGSSPSLATVATVAAPMPAEPATPAVPATGR